jgi:uroporphyrinogen decarboxylase
MQTSQEVIDALLRKGSPERVGLNDSPWHDTLRKWVAQGMPADEEGVAVDAAEHFGFDLAGCGGGFDWHPIQGQADVVEETDEWKIVRNGSGAQLKWWKDKSGTPEHVAFEMTSREIWEKDYRPHLPGTAAERRAEQIEPVREDVAKRRGQRKWAFYGSQFIWENMRGSMGDVCLYESLLLDPGWIRDYCRVYTDLTKEAYRILIEQSGRPDGIWLYEDLGYRDRLFCSPRTYRELIFPYYAEMVEFYHARDLPVVLHTCGFTEPALDLIVEAGFDGLHPMEVKAGNDPLRIAENYGEKLCLIGGLDERILESGDRDLIRRQVRRLVEGMKARGARYVYASDHSISTNVDYDDFRFAIDVYRECMMY